MQTKSITSVSIVMSEEQNFYGDMSLSKLVTSLLSSE